MNSDYFGEEEKDFLVENEECDYKLFCTLVGRRD